METRVLFEEGGREGGREGGGRGEGGGWREEGEKKEGRLKDGISYESS